MPLLCCQQVRFVYEQERLAFSGTRALLAFWAFDIVNICFQVLTAESQWISSIDDLYHKVGPFKHSPQLSPHFNIPFKRRQEKAHLFLQPCKGENNHKLSQGVYLQGHGTN